jgi:hypothetical protein
VCAHPASAPVKASAAPSAAVFILIVNLINLPRNVRRTS